MKEPRLPPALDLLRSDDDVPVPAGHERRIREALAVQLAGSGPPSATKEPARDAAPDGAAPSTSGAGVQGIAGLKLVTALMIAAGAGAVGFVAGRSSAPAPSVVATAAPVPASVTAPPIATSAPATVSAEAPASPAPSVPSSTAPRNTNAPAASVAPGNAGGPQASAFDREQSLLERARAALARHDAEAAEAALATSAREFPTSKHAEERAYLHILVLRERGKMTEAQSAARAFLSAYPESLLRGRVEPMSK